MSEEQKARERCLQCLRMPCLCVAYPGMKISDDDLIDAATSCSSRAVRLKAEIVLRQRHPVRRRS